ncbi:MAG: cofactor-independent phosphoglycerate mutase [Phycisphaerae bacterium]
MKYAIIIPDGAADLPIDALDGRTALEAADLPNINSLVHQGRIGMVQTVPENFPPGSDVAIMSVLGYDPKKYYTGRAPLEAAAMGLKLTADQMVFRCNLVTIIDGIMEDFSAGHIATEQAHKIIDALNEKMGNPGVKFYPGVSYRHLMVTTPAEKFKNFQATPPHDISGQPVANFLPRGNGSEFIRGLMAHSQEFLSELEVNQVRRDLGENPATSIWLWGQGQKPTLDRFKKIYGVSGAAITAVDLVRGLAKLIGWKIIEVQGATGWVDTNYQGKAQAACNVLDEVDIVVVHVEGPDEAGHNGDHKNKIYALEQIDRQIVQPVFEKLNTFSQWRMMVLPDHPTPVSLKTHTASPVPFVMAGTGIHSGGMEKFTEDQAETTGLKIDRGWQLMEYFLKG